jgi:pyruvate kinase
VSAPALTEKDVLDAKFALELGVDFLALSFVRWPADVEELRALISESGRDVPIISKIEKPEALENIEAIIDASDAIMVARGDLGVELPPESVPNVQEELVDLARARTKPVIVATQMLESMMEHPRPTRAEVTDVANAVRSGADAVMLSGESAAGRYPLAAVKMMDLVVRQTESYLHFHGAFGTFDAYTPTAPRPKPPLAVRDAVANAAALLSRELLVRAVIVVGGSRSLSVMSAARPAAPLIGASNDCTGHAMACLTWGAIPVDVGSDDPNSPAVASRIARGLGLAESGHHILLVSGFRSDPSRSMPTVTVVAVE